MYQRPEKNKKSLYVDISCFIIVAMVTHCATKRPFYHVYVGKNFYGGGAKFLLKPFKSG